MLPVPEAVLDAVRAGPGDLAAFDATQPMDIAGTASDSITMQIPRKAIAARLSRVPDIHGRILDDPMGYLLADHFHALVRQLPHVEQSDSPTLANATRR